MVEKAPARLVAKRHEKHGLFRVESEVSRFERAQARSRVLVNRPLAGESKTLNHQAFDTACTGLQRDHFQAERVWTAGVVRYGPCS
jgi:hypothetical protein